MDTTLIKIATGMGGLILLYLAITNADAANNIINSISNNVNNQVAALQGR